MKISKYLQMLQNLLVKLLVKPVKKMSTIAEKPLSKMQASFKQLLAKTGRIGDNVKMRELGQIFKSRWYYFAIVIIMFIVAIPLTKDPGIPSFAQINQSRGDILRENAAEVPYDLFSQQQASEIVADSVLEESADPAAKLVPSDELEKTEPKNQEHAETSTGTTAKSEAATEATSANQTDAHQESQTKAKQDKAQDQQQQQEQQDKAQDQQQQQQTKEQTQLRPPIKLSYPVKGNIVGNYGFGYSKAFDDYRFNPGINIETPLNAQVKAAAPGKVVTIDDNLSYNNFLMIQHEHNYITLYANLSEIKVEHGAKVDENTVIALSGPPGYNSLGIANNLFFQVTYKGEVVDPNQFLTKQ